MEGEDYLDDAAAGFDEDAGGGAADEGGEGGNAEDEAGSGVRGATATSLLRQHPEVVVPSKEELRAGLERGRHVTFPFLTPYERTKVLSLRASQLAQGAVPLLLQPPAAGTEALAVAVAELAAGVLPFVLRRPLPDGTYEYLRLGGTYGAPLTPSGGAYGAPFVASGGSYGSLSTPSLHGRQAWVS